MNIPLMAHIYNIVNVLKIFDWIKHINIHNSLNNNFKYVAKI